jgi:hypothetical protein
LQVAVIPHYNNAEGGTHDTRFCYLGESRLGFLETQLPPDTFVLGIDEHTAITFDLDDRVGTIAGLGVVTVRVAGRSHTFPVGATLPIDEILQTAEELARGVGGSAAGDNGGRDVAGSAGGRGGVASSGDSADVDSAGALTGAGGAGDPSGVAGLSGVVGTDTPAAAYTDSPLITLVREREGGFAAALARRDVEGAVGEVLELETQITQWATDIPFGDAMDRARASLRSLVVELGRAGEAGVRDPRQVVGPFVEAMLELRTRARSERRFEESDWIRDRLDGLGVEVRDTAEGSEWLLSS